MMKTETIPNLFRQVVKQSELQKKFELDSNNVARQIMYLINSSNAMR